MSTNEETIETGTEVAGEPTKDEKTMAMLCHILSFVGIMIPFGNIIAPLVLWIIKKDEMPFVDDQGKEVINFQITISIAIFACSILFFLFLPLLLIPVIGIVDIIFTVIGAIKANEGERYRYPFAIRLLK